MKIVVLGGGISTERQVSIATSVSVCKALRSRGHHAIFVDMFYGVECEASSLDTLFFSDYSAQEDAVVGKNVPNLEGLKKDRRQGKSTIGKNVLELCSLADFVFLGLHGKDGEDGKIQAVLDLMGVPYSGAGMLGSAIAMDKAFTKRIMQSIGVLTPEWQEVILTNETIPVIAKEAPFPCVIKAVDGGSSIGVKIPAAREEIERDLRDVLCYSKKVIIEQKVDGREFTQPILGDTYLCAIEIIPPESGVFDYTAKYQAGEEGALEICPADISAELQKTLGEKALQLHNALGLEVYSRTDFILDSDGNAWCLEVNTLPGLTAASLFPKAAKNSGIDYAELCDKIIALSLEKYYD